jgi:hypothetical protein
MIPTLTQLEKTLIIFYFELYPHPIQSKPIQSKPNHTRFSHSSRNERKRRIYDHGMSAGRHQQPRQRRMPLIFRTCVPSRSRYASFPRVLVVCVLCVCVCVCVFVFGHWFDQDPWTCAVVSNPLNPHNSSHPNSTLLQITKKR